MCVFMHVYMCIFRICIAYTHMRASTQEIYVYTDRQTDRHKTDLVNVLGFRYPICIHLRCLCVGLACGGKDLGAGEDEGIVKKSHCLFLDLSTQQDGDKESESGR
jgi:hypothetical protein